MSLLIDRIRTGLVPLATPPWLSSAIWPAWQKTVEHILANDLPTAEVFLIDNVARYYYEERCQTWDMTKDFPNLVPPFDRLWLEYRHVPKVLETEDGTEATAGRYVMRDNDANVGSTGILLVNHDFEKFPELRQDADEGKLIFSRDLITPEIRWTVCAQLFVEKPGPQAKTQALITTVYFGLRHDGSVAWFTPTRFVRELFDETVQKRNVGGVLMMIPAFLAVSFMHCRNVVSTDVRPARVMQSLFTAKSGGKPMVDYKTLKIEPMKKVLRHEGRSESTGIVHALHICRGHFKDFREGKGLGRGHAHGLYWWGDQVRGSAERGVVEKTYDVQKPVTTENEQG